MRSTCREALPLFPLLHAYSAPGLPSLAELHQLPGLGSRFSAVLSATAKFLFDQFLDTSSESEMSEALERFYSAVVAPPLHLETLRRRAGFVRHGIVHLLRGRDPLPERLQSCLSSTGVYRVPGLGPSFWSAIVQGLHPGRHPGWTPTIRAGLERLGLTAGMVRSGPADLYSSLLELHGRIRSARPDLLALHIDHFLALLAVMPGRNLHAGGKLLHACPVTAAIRRTRAHTPLRQRLKQRGAALAAAQERIEAGLAARDGKQLGDALAAADPDGCSRCPLDWGRHDETLTLWIGRLWESDDPYPLLAQWWAADPLPGAGLWLPAAVLHLRDPQKFAVYCDEQRQGHARIDDGLDAGDPPAERYRLFNEAVAWLRDKHALHPLEVADVLAVLGADEPRSEARPERLPPRTALPRSDFRGFCGDTFAFLEELARENRRSWMDGQRDRYRFTVRGPLTELCRALASRYVKPVLIGSHGWRLDTEARSGRAMTSICKNGFGKGLPYNSSLWITFCKEGAKRAGAQLFVRLASEGVRYGLRLGSSAKDERLALRASIERHGESLFRQLLDNGALSHCRFGLADLPESQRVIEDAAGLSAWSAGRTLEASCSRPANDPLLAGEDLVGEIILAFDRLLPLFAAALEPGPTLPVRCRSDARQPSSGYRESDFLEQTYLDRDWLHSARELLSLKKQLILQGVPGTGKTHVARCLGQLLAGGVPEATRLVQFHPAYSYEEFVEGIKVKSVAVDGRHDVTYPVEEGLLCSFAARAAAAPAQPHVLVIDEINRGNLPRIFGELLYLLEYRGQAVELPYSRRAFHLPENLYLLATMNAADRSIAVVDHALRRRFSFMEMEPSAAVLAAWLEQHRPAAGPAFTARVLSLFERLNARLRSDLGAGVRIGHSYFMVPGLDEGRLRMVWRHHIRPLLDEHFSGQPGRAAAYDQLLETDVGRARSRAEAVSPS
jgi:5-methylcytosine-specific restriction protein B